MANKEIDVVQLVGSVILIVIGISFIPAMETGIQISANGTGIPASTVVVIGIIPLIFGVALLLNITRQLM